MRQLKESDTWQECVFSEVATRRVCQTCGSSMYMDCGEAQTLWMMALGSITRGSVLSESDPARDSQIYCQSAVAFGKDLEQLLHLNEFGK
jgi:hypothetical protein